jgi:hypothetical protein
MRLIRNAGNDRVVDLLREWAAPGFSLDVATPKASLFAFESLLDELTSISQMRVALPGVDQDLGLLGGEADRATSSRSSSATGYRRPAR